MGSKKSIPGSNNSPGNPLTPGLVLLPSTAISSTNTYTSPVFNAINLDNIGLDVVFTGTPTGTLTVNCSIDGVVFTSLTFNPVLTQPSGGNLRYLISLNQLPYPYLQVSYTNSSGSGTLQVNLSGKDIN